MHQSTLGKSEYRADIDGIRSLAVLSVLIFHLNPAWLPGGFLGVDVFFVVSGYLITGIILRENHLQTFSFRHFYARRVKRIFPALFTVLGLSAAVGTFLLHPQTYINFMTSSRYASAQLANFFFARNVGYFEEGFAEQPLLHIWTLGVEEQFYLFWPLLIVFLFWLFKPRKTNELPFEANHKDRIVNSPNISKNISAVFILISLISFTACFILAETHYNIAFYMFYTRAWEFCIGGFVALGLLQPSSSKYVNNTISLLGLLLLCSSFFIVSEEFLNVSFLQIGVILPCIGTALIIYSGTQKGLANRLLSAKIPVFIGKISYSLYLFHWPIIIFSKNFNNGSELSFSNSIWIIFVSFILATLCYFLIEQPARKTKTLDRWVLTSAILAIAVFAAGFKILESYDTAPWRITQYTSGKRGEYSAKPRDCVNIKDGLVKYRECKTSNTPNTPYVALVGDSHAIHFLNSTVSWAKQSGYNVIYLSVPGCPMLLGDVHFGSSIDPKHEPQCKAALPFFEKEIVNNKNVEHILLAQRFDLHYYGKTYLEKRQLTYFKDASGKKVKDHTKYYRDQLAYTTEAIRKAGKNLMILKQVPLFPGNKDCEWEPRLKKWLSNDTICSYDTKFIAKWQQPSINFINDFIEAHQVSAFDPALYLEKPRKRDRNLYGNTDHLNGNGCHYLVPYFIKEMNNIISLNHSGINDSAAM